MWFSMAPWGVWSHCAMTRPRGSCVSMCVRGGVEVVSRKPKGS